MTFEDFRDSLAAGAPPLGLDAPLRSLWWDRKGDWERAHETAAREESNQDAAWVHAYLHRREGDPGNARYWYGRARRPVCDQPLDQEWASMVSALLARPDAAS
jgi:hypothetical protein